MPNFPGPYELEFVVTMPNTLTPIRQHVIRINCAVVGSPATGTPMTSITVQKQGGGTATAKAVADQFWSFIRLAYITTASCSSVVLWKYVPGTFAKDFVSAASVASPAGASASAVAIAQQATLSFRTAGGSVLKLVLLEVSQGGDNRIPLIPNAAGAWFERIAAYIMSADSVALGRDDGYVVSPLNYALGQNERIWRKVYRGV